ncbi:ABC transporter substrate-binding protein [Moritella sp. Urea-trap-13]|uniref:ABC transporter substrate-binding protein n=1 Tax=Moritella sp. Urea-trap-13 TaxID=2058327 RepID=UPI000C32AAA7|nr:ABC transporter substrate-binding protein [Moritella sp. Urea-trap-13]PKH05270.1 ABC transporter substrate-binding protein [Moritella sp. Urea-trap-13]
MNKGKVALSLSIASIITLGLSGCSDDKAAKDSSSVAAKKPVSFVYCSEASPEGFNPALFTTGTTFDASSKTIFNRLVEFKLGTTEVIPALAESWEVSEDGLVYTFKLRHDVPFHTTTDFTPTRSFNADDVIFSFDRQGNAENPYHKISGGSYEYYNAMSMGSLIKEINKVDEYTVQFVLNQPEAPFIANLAMDFASIMSAEQAKVFLEKGMAAQLDVMPSGTGPFALQQYQKDSLIRYAGNADYWGGAPAIDRLVFSITPDASVRFAKLQNNECQVMAFPNPSDRKMMEEDKNINLLSQEGLNIGYLAFNVNKKPFDDVRVRQALNMAVNKPAIIDAVFNGSGKAATNPIPPTMWSYNTDIKDYEFDLVKAKALLAEAGYPDGFETNIWAMPVQRPYNPNARRMAEIMQSDWAKVGVKAKIVTFEWGEYLKRASKGEHETILLGWTGDNGDPDNFLAVLLGCDAVGGANRSMWCNAEFDALVKEAKTTADQAVRTDLYEKAQVIFKQQAPWATIAHSVVFEPVRKEVKGYVIDPLGGHNFYSVSLEK